jgi:hypothetical protein
MEYSKRLRLFVETECANACRHNGGYMDYAYSDSDMLCRCNDHKIYHVHY